MKDVVSQTYSSQQLGRLIDTHLSMVQNTMVTAGMSSAVLPLPGPSGTSPAAGASK